MTRPHSWAGRDIFTLPDAEGRPQKQEWARTIEKLYDEVLKKKIKSAEINFTNPHLSRALRDNLAKSAGGIAEDNTAAFNAEDDPNYLALLTAIKAGKADLEGCPRIDMPGAVPIPQDRNFGKVFDYRPPRKE
jgi:hypothetical protein